MATVVQAAYLYLLAPFLSGVHACCYNVVTSFGERRRKELKLHANPERYERNAVSFLLETSRVENT
jgi:hypothetical protein